MRKRSKRTLERRRIRLLCLVTFLLLPTLLGVALTVRRNDLPTLFLPPPTDRTYLVLGRDNVGNNTDVMMLLRLDGIGGRGTVMQLPRDTLLRYGEGEGKLNALYAFYRATSGTKEAYTRLTETLSELLGIRLDGYIALDLVAFRRIVDAIGGVTLRVPTELVYEDPIQGLTICLPAGEQHLDGAKAEQFVRCRNAYVRADLGRVDAQKIFLAAFAARLRDGFSAKELLAVGEQLLRHVDTSVSLGDLPTLLSTLLTLTPEHCYLMTAPGETTENGRYYVLNRAGMVALLHRYFSSASPFDPAFAFCGQDNIEAQKLASRAFREEQSYQAEHILTEGLPIAVRGQ